MTDSNALAFWNNDQYSSTSTDKVVRERFTFPKNPALDFSVGVWYSHNVFCSQFTCTLSTCCICHAAKRQWQPWVRGALFWSQQVEGIKKNKTKKTFNLFREEIRTGELNYSAARTAPCDDNIVPSRPDTQNTKRYFCGVGNCQRNPPLSCLCMHKEHQRLVSDPQMDDLNVTLASKAEQQRNPQNSQRRQLPELPPPTPLSHSCALSLCLPLRRGFVSLIFLSYPPTFWLLCPPLLVSLLSLSFIFFLPPPRPPHARSISSTLPFSHDLR